MYHLTLTSLAGLLSDMFPSINSSLRISCGHQHPAPLPSPSNNVILPFHHSPRHKNLTSLNGQIVVFITRSDRKFTIKAPNHSKSFHSLKMKSLGSLHIPKKMIYPVLTTWVVILSPSTVSACHALFNTPFEIKSTDQCIKCYHTGMLSLY